jgi:hypothetical protein
MRGNASRITGHRAAAEGWCPSGQDVQDEIVLPQFGVLRNRAFVEVALARAGEREVSRSVTTAWGLNMSYGELRAPDRSATDEADEPGHSGIVHHHECIRDARRSFENPGHVVSDTPEWPHRYPSWVLGQRGRCRREVVCRKRAGGARPDTVILLRDERLRHKPAVTVLGTLLPSRACG